MSADVTTELYIDGQWEAKPCYTAEGITAMVGPNDETGTRPNKITWTLANPDLELDDENPESSLYHQIGLNTPARLRIGSGPTTITVGEASRWEPDTTEDHTVSPVRGRSWVTMDAEGLLRRIGRWDDLLDSPLKRQIESYSTLTGYWPLEGGNTDTTVLAEVSGVQGAQPGSFQGNVTMAGDGGPGGSADVIELGSGATVGGTFRRHHTSGFQLVFHYKLPAVPSSASYANLMQFKLSNGNVIEWQVNSTSYRILVTESDGTSLVSNAVLFGAGVSPANWIRYRIKVTVSSGTVSVEPAWYQQDGITYGTSSTYSSSFTGAPLTWASSANAWTENGALAHVFGITDTSFDLINYYDAIRAFDGYLGETAGDRFLRLLGEQGLAGALLGAAGVTVPMGRQRPETLAKLLEQCVVTDGGLMFDDATAVAVVMRTRVHIQESGSVLTLTKGVNVAKPLRPVTDDDGVYNDITVKNYNDASARYVLEAGRKSIQEPPNGVGRYLNTVDVCQQSDELLPDRAVWEVAKATVDRRRYKKITVDLLAHPALTATLAGMDPGDTIKLEGATPETLWLHVINFEWKIEDTPVRVTLTCRPAEAWLFGVYDAVQAHEVARYDATFSTTRSTATTTATTLLVHNPVLDDCWGDDDAPYDLMVAGERMTCTAVTAPSLSGGMYRQDLTVTRSVNGVVKTHAADETVELADPRRYAYFY